MKSHAMDRKLLWIALALFTGGILILTSASMVISEKNFGSIGYYAAHQLLFGGLGGAGALLVCQWIPYRLWRRAALPAMLVSLFLLMLVFFPKISYAYGGARRWLAFGPLTFQPSELLKISFIVYLASWLDARRRALTSMAYSMLPFAVMLSVIGIFLVMQPDIGTLGVITVTAGLLYFLGGGKVSQIAVLILLGILIFYLLVQFEPYRTHRILVFFNPNLDPQGIGYQINQAFIAIGSGGSFGLGFGRSVQKYHYLPEPISDSIFAVFAEEMGLFGALLLLMGFWILFWRGMLIASRAPDGFGRLLAAGISIGIAVQAFINMAAISGLLPLTGIPLPFVSYGSTSLVITLASIGILLNISKYTAH